MQRLPNKASWRGDAWSVEKAAGYGILNSLALRFSDKVFYKNFQSHVFEIKQLLISISVNMTNGSQAPLDRSAVEKSLPKSFKDPMHWGYVSWKFCYFIKSH